MEPLKRLSVSEVTTLHSSFDSDVTNYSAAGLGGIGLWESKLAGRDLDEVGGQLSAAGVRVTNLVPTGNSVFPNTLDPQPVDPRVRTEALIAKLPSFCSLEPETIVVVTGNVPGLDPAELRQRCVSELRRIAVCAGELGLTVALEPMHPSAADDFSFVDTLAAAANLVGDVDQASLGILFDTWHVGQGRDAVDELRALVDLVVGVHVADALPPPRGWADRQFPGEGTLPIAQFLSVLESNGFKGSYDVEIFSDDGTFGSRFPDSLWELPDEVCLARATELLRGLLANTCPTAPSPTDAHIRETTFNQERRHV